MLRVGRITGAHGLRGALRFRPDNPESDTLEHLTHVYLEIGAETLKFKLNGVTRLNRSTLRLTLENVTDADAAEALKGAAVMIAPQDVPATGPGEFYYFQAIGCEVMLTDGSRLGKIEEVFSNGAHDIWVVRDGEREI